MRRPTVELVEQMTRDAMRADTWSEVARCAALLDELDTPRRAVSLRSAALWYAEHGLRVFPLRPRLKTPYERSHGCRDATCDVAQVDRWWTTAPQSNIGISTGHVVDVIDIDGLTGVTSIAEHIDEVRARSIGLVSTPRAGGLHFYVPHESGRKNRVSLLPGVDTRGVGGYIIAPPSATDVGTYRWLRPLTL